MKRLLYKFLRYAILEMIRANHRGFASELSCELAKYRYNQEGSK